MRDLFTGEIYRLSELELKIVLKIRRWMRFYGVVVDLGDGTWS